MTAVAQMPSRRRRGVTIGHPVHVDILRTADRRAFDEAVLVLLSAGVPHETRHEGRIHVVAVAQDDVDRAIDEIDDFLQENRGVDVPAPVPEKRASPWPGVIGYTIVLWGLFLAERRVWMGLDWRWSGRSHGASVQAGEWWRAVTALTLHVDHQHLLGNLFFGAIFGGLLTSVVGTGVAWSTVLLAGVVGNLLDSYLGAATSTSIGASTAVFGALGALAAWQIAFARGTNLPFWRRWGPIAFSIGLLGYMGGGGERTDVLAHVTGFVCGIAIGFSHSRWTTKRALPKWADALLSLFPLAVIAIAWTFAHQPPR